jgi:hypothetical protein
VTGEPKATSAAEVDHPGRPRAADELDPELIRLERRRVRVGPILALSVIALCAVMMWRLRGDLAFARQGDEPAEVDLAAARAAASDRFVALTARPDRVDALHVYQSRARDGYRLMPVLGASGALWVMFDGDPWDEPPVARERQVGRVRRLGDLPFFDLLVRAAADGPALPVAIDVDALRAALADGGRGLRDPTGQVLPLAPDTELTIRETVAGRARVTASATDDHPDEMAWQAALIRAGVAPPGTTPQSGTPGTWTFEVPAPGGVDAVAAALAAAKLYATLAAPVVREHRAPWSSLAATADGVAVADAEVPWASVSSIALALPPPRPLPDARVVVTSETPADYWYVWPIVLALAALIALFAWGLVRALREPSAA